MTEYRDINLPGFQQGSNLAANFIKLLSELEIMNLSLKAILDHGISVDDNMDLVVVNFTSNASPDTEDTVPHTLGKIPTYFIVADIDKGGVVYRSGTAFTATNVYMKTSVASAAVKLFLL